MPATRYLLCRLPALASLGLLALGLAACGGGGDGGGTNNTAPVADAGADRTVDDNAAVTLDASASSDADGDSLTYRWKKTAGPDVDLSGADKKTATFTAPAVPGGTEFTFELAVSDGAASAKDTVTVTVNDVTAPTVEIAPDSNVLGKSEPVVITFSEPVAAESAILTGAIADEGAASWSDDNTVLTLTPKADDGEWISGSGKTLSVSTVDAADNIAEDPDAEFLVKLVFENFQAADIVIGQPDMTTSASAGGDDSLGGTLYGSAAVDSEGTLYLPDYQSARILGFNGFPQANGKSADFIIGQPDFTTSTSGTSDKLIFGPQSLSVHGDRLVVTEYSNKRISIYTPRPTDTQNSKPGTIAVVVGQPDKESSSTDCAANRLHDPESSTVSEDGRLIVADSGNNRVLVWNELPAGDGQPADLVLGQRAFNTCAENDQNGNGDTDGPAATTMHSPTGVWSDGEKLAVIDSDNNRVLLWNSFPTSNAQPADVVLGQPDFETADYSAAAEDTFGWPYIGITSNGEQLFVTDGFNRTLIWNSWPETNQQPADTVLGQENFSLDECNDGDGDDAFGPRNAQAQCAPHGVSIYKDKLIVTDGSNFRYLIYTSK